MNGNRLFGMSLWMLVFAAAVARGAPGAPAPATKPASRLVPFLKVIREAEDYRVTMRAYARATVIDRDNLTVHRTYMRRMLQLGLPQIAYYPALTLTRLDRSAGTAWGVVGYMHGRRGELAEALSASIRALETLRDDRSVLHNAGQLLAWYDTDPSLPRLPDSVRRSLAGMRDRLGRNPTFAKAHKGIIDAYTRRAAAAAELEKQLAAATADANVARRLAEEVDRQLRHLRDEIEYRNRLIDDLWRDLRRYYYDSSYYRDAAGTVVVVTTPRRRYRYDMLDRIREEERALETMKLKVRQVRREGRAVLAELARKQAALGRIQQQLQREAFRIEREFRWDPPAVDGVVTAELDRFPPTTRPSTIQLPVDPQSEATQQLDLARLYLRHEMSEKAVQILRQIASKYGSTKAGKQAKLLLAALRPTD